MAFISTCISFLKLVILNPVESVTAIAALVLLNAFLFRHVVVDRRARWRAQLLETRRRRGRQQARQERKMAQEIQARLDALTFESCSQQERSPLFTVLPGELRNAVFRAALVQHDGLDGANDNDAYPEDSYWYRPGFRGPRRSSAALLRTCKRAYLEARLVLAQEAEHAFWFNRGPAGRSGMHNFTRFFNALGRRDAGSGPPGVLAVRFFTQMFWIENGHNLNRAMSHARFAPERLTITFRYSDWWFWEDNQPLRMEERWLRVFYGPSSLKELVVEYETIAWKRDEMMRFVLRNRAWKLRLRDGQGHLSAEDTQLSEWRWQGPSKLGGGVWSHHGSADSIEYVVVVDRWTRRPGDVCPEDQPYIPEHSDSDSSLSPWENDIGNRGSDEESDIGDSIDIDWSDYDGYI